MPVRSRTPARRHSVAALTLALAWSLVQPMLPGSLPGSPPTARAADPSPFLGERTTGPDGPAIVADVAVPTGFVDQVALSGLVNPTVVRFSPDGRVFVAEKRGVIKVFDSLTDSSPSVYADIQTNVNNYWDRGLLGMALHPNFPATPEVYVLYARDAAIDEDPARWDDGCPDPPGGTSDGCVVSGQLSRFTGSAVGGAEQPLITDWCQQFPSHSVGSLQFGPDGMLYVSGGDGASFTFTDIGQNGSPDQNPCGDPPGGVGGQQTAPTAEGGALRSQDVRTPSDPAGLDGALLRLDPATGNAAPGNPAAGSADANARRIVLYGMRNPFRFAFRPGTSEAWLADVGYSDWEEINRVAANPPSVKNLGWPCYEGTGHQGAYDDADLDMCESLYAAGTSAVVAPYFVYGHADKVVAGETCPTEFGSAISGIAFYQASDYPPEFANALFFSDYSRDCIWAVPAGDGGLPDVAQRLTFVAGASNPVNLEIGPGGDLFYVDFDGGTIHRVRYVGNHAPTALAAATPDSGQPPLTVQLSGSGSTDPDDDPLGYAWDLDADGQYDDASGVTISHVYQNAGAYQPALRVNDGHGGVDTDMVTVNVGSGPVATIVTPIGGSGSTWSVGQTIGFSGNGTDP